MRYLNPIHPRMDREVDATDNSPDQELLERISTKDESALGELYDRHASVAFALSLHVLGDRAGAEDVLQGVFVNIWQGADQYDPERGSPTTWLLTCVRNLAVDRLRQRADRKRSEPRPGGTIEQVPDDQREAIELAYFAGLTLNQISEKRGEPPGTIKTRMRLGMATLRQMLVKK